MNFLEYNKAQLFKLNCGGIITMIKHRTFKDSDAEEVANLVKETMLTTNIKEPDLKLKCNI
ncbi:hypothetical protein ACFSF7_08155 [Ligilactobacillus acidipiscis]|uniref:hypothetical protein n=1 Tax=Ligilactobacillus acidipiscis TaxID=89059 RepID=UPI0036434E6A